MRECNGATNEKRGCGRDRAHVRAQQKEGLRARGKTSDGVNGWQLHAVDPRVILGSGEG
jgi:hypothetical protein